MHQFDFIDVFKIYDSNASIRAGINEICSNECGNSLCHDTYIKQ